MRFRHYSILAAIFVLMGSTYAFGGTFSVQAGNLYTVIQGGIAEYSSTLTQIATLQISGVTVTEGVAFTPQGNMVLSAFESDNNDHVIEVNSVGSIIHDLNLHIGGLDRSSDGIVDSAGYIYEASRPNLQRISPDFSSVTTLPYSFSRSSGVTIGPNGLLYATDQGTAKLITFNASLNPQTIVSTQPTPTGLAFDSSGRLLLGEYDSNIGRLDVINPVTGAETLITDDAGISDIVGAPDGSYYVSYNIGHEIAHVSAQDVVLSTVSTADFSDSIAIAPSVPEPATGGIVLLIALTRSLSFRTKREKI